VPLGEALLITLVMAAGVVLVEKVPQLTMSTGEHAIFYTFSYNKDSSLFEV